MNRRITMTTGRRWAYGGAALGVGLSVAANIEHVLVQGPAPIGAVVSAAACPVILLVALEIIARTRWPEGRRWLLLRWLALPTVAVVAASISYLHMRSLLLAYGESVWAATVGPLAVDGLMAVAVGALLVPLEKTQPATADAVQAGRGIDVAVTVEQLAQSSPPEVERRALASPRAPRVEPRRPRRTVNADGAKGQILAVLAERPARQADVIRATGLARRTVRDHLAALVESGRVTRSGAAFTVVPPPDDVPAAAAPATPTADLPDGALAGAR